MARICLITPHHISFQPRTLREADSLAAAGHNVRVVSRQTDRVLTEYDRVLMQTRAWRLQSVELQRHGPAGARWLTESVRSKIYGLLVTTRVNTDSMAIRSYVRAFGRLVALAAAEQADWFIAHTQGALPIAVAASARWNAKLGFDCEDLLAENGTDAVEMVRLIEKRYLPVCDYVSVPSRCLGSRLKQTYSVSAPLVLYNVSSLHLANGLKEPKRRTRNPALRLHWFGQTIGAGRGIEEAIAALGLLRDLPTELHLRGRLSSEFRERIESLSRMHQVSGEVVFHPPVGPQALIGTMDKFDVGLALERPDHGNYSLAATNKLFSYALAGLAIAATDTPGHRELLEQVPSAGILYPAGNPERLAEALRRWSIDAGALRTAQQAAWDAARERFCWDIEQEKFLTALGLGNQTMNSSPGGLAAIA